MKLLLLLLLLILAGCSHCEFPMERLKVCGGSQGMVLVYDPGTDTLAWVDTVTMRIVKRYPHWSRGS